jgi:DNA-binding beta-propeller fold protein YncE
LVIVGGIDTVSPVEVRLEMKNAMSPIVVMLAIVCQATTGTAQTATQSGRLVLVAGGGNGGEGSPVDRAELTSPFGVGFDAERTLFFVEMTGNHVRKIGPDGLVTTIAGTGRKGDGGDDGPAAKAELNGPHSLAVTKSGDVYVTDTWNNRVRKIDARSGRITTVAGTGRKGFSGDGGPATQAEFGGIYCLALDEAGQTLDLADLDNRRVRRIDLATGTVSTVAGNGKKGVPNDGDDARSSPLVDPRAVALDGRGHLYILERSGHALRVVDRAGKIRTVAGTGQQGDSGDGGDARQARMNGPKHLCVDPRGNVLIADTENHRIRLYNPEDGTIRAVAGTGHKGTKGLGGAPEDAELAQPHGVTIAPGGILYISDSSNNRIVKIVPR